MLRSDLLTQAGVLTARSDVLTAMNWYVTVVSMEITADRGAVTARSDVLTAMSETSRPAT